jgi:hypothetical protein
MSCILTKVLGPFVILFESMEEAMAMNVLVADTHEFSDTDWGSGNKWGATCGQEKPIQLPSPLKPQEYEVVAFLSGMDVQNGHNYNFTLHTEKDTGFFNLGVSQSQYNDPCGSAATASLTATYMVLVKA